mmetsp:Transcript_93959/g.223600  ORF Transcript_93959/g.223600 Transcript_93959/m.223600 type:complete len:236 (-) Transcript_93959:960-1667(-)
MQARSIFSFSEQTCMKAMSNSRHRCLKPLCSTSTSFSCTRWTSLSLTLPPITRRQKVRAKRARSRLDTRSYSACPSTTSSEGSRFAREFKICRRSVGSVICARATEAPRAISIVCRLKDFSRSLCALYPDWGTRSSASCSSLVKYWETTAFFPARTSLVWMKSSWQLGSVHMASSYKHQSREKQVAGILTSVLGSTAITARSLAAVSALWKHVIFRSGQNASCKEWGRLARQASQ